MCSLADEIPTVLSLGGQGCSSVEEKPRVLSLMPQTGGLSDLDGHRELQPRPILPAPFLRRFTKSVGSRSRKCEEPCAVWKRCPQRHETVHYSSALLPLCTLQPVVPSRPNIVGRFSRNLVSVLVSAALDVLLNGSHPPCQTSRLLSKSSRIFGSASEPMVSSKSSGSIGGDPLESRLSQSRC